MGDFRGLCQKLPHMQSLKVRIFLNGGHNFKPISYNFRHKNNIVFSEQPEKILNLTSHPIIIQTLICSFVTFF